MLRNILERLWAYEKKPREAWEALVGWSLENGKGLSGGLGAWRVGCRKLTRSTLGEVGR